MLRLSLETVRTIASLDDATAEQILNYYSSWKEDTPADNPCTAKEMYFYLFSRWLQDKGLEISQMDLMDDMGDSFEWNLEYDIDFITAYFKNDYKGIGLERSFENDLANSEKYRYCLQETLVNFFMDLLLWNEEDGKYLTDLFPDLRDQDFPWAIKCTYIEFDDEYQEGNVGIALEHYSFNTQDDEEDTEPLRQDEIYSIDEQNK